jgi:hypothetical protein
MVEGMQVTKGSTLQQGILSIFVKRVEMFNLAFIRYGNEAEVGQGIIVSKIASRYVIVNMYHISYI